MKLTQVSPLQGEYVLTEAGVEYIRYAGGIWNTLIDAPTGEVEQEVDDYELEEQLEAAYQEHMK